MNKEERMKKMCDMVSQGHGRSDIFTIIMKENPDVSRQQISWDWTDSKAYEQLPREVRKKIEVGREPGIEDHIDMRASIYNDSMETGQVQLALNAAQDMAKLQGLYTERKVVDSTVTFKFEFEPVGGYRPSIPGVSAPILVEGTVIDGDSTDKV